MFVLKLEDRTDKSSDKSNFHALPPAIAAAFDPILFFLLAVNKKIRIKKLIAILFL